MSVDEVATFHTLQKNMSIYGGIGSKNPLALEDTGTVDNEYDHFFYLTDAKTQFLP